MIISGELQDQWSSSIHLDRSTFIFRVMMSDCFSFFGLSKQNRWGLNELN